MKRLTGFLLGALIFSACDDGDLTFESLNFDDVPVERCAGDTGNLLYKLNGGEALVVSVGTTASAFDIAFPDNPDLPDALPRSIPINGTTNRVAYQLFNGDATDAIYCSPIPPIDPVAVEEWNATSGIINIITTQVTSENTTDGFEGGTKITGYNHNIVFTNINFNKSDGTTQLYPTFDYGSFLRPVKSELTLPRLFDDEVAICDDNETVYNIAGNHSMVVVIDSTLLDGTIMDTPRTGTISTTANRFIYSIYPVGIVVDENEICSDNTALSPVQTWLGEGQIEVTTTSGGGTSLSHTIRLKNVVLRRGNSSFILATDYLLGTLLTAD